MQQRLNLTGPLISYSLPSGMNALSGGPAGTQRADNSAANMATVSSANERIF